MKRALSARTRIALALLVAACGVETPLLDENYGAGTAGTPAGGSSSGISGSSAGGGAARAGATSIGGAGAGGQPSLTGGAGAVAGMGGASPGMAGSGSSNAGGSGARGSEAGAGTGGAQGGAAGSNSDAGGTAGSAGGAAGNASAGQGTAGAGGGGKGGTEDITLWIAGDSTVANGNTPCPVGWAKSFDALFNTNVSVTNSAAGGRSVHTWLYNVGTTLDDATGECTLERDQDGDPTLQGRWQQMLDGMKTGDYLFVQFGINDGDPSCDRHVGLEAFKTAYGMMASAAKERGANPIFVTPVSAVACNGSTPRATRGAFVTATQEAGTEYDVPVIDLHALSIELYAEQNFCPIPGGDVSASTTGTVGDFFCDDHTHFSAAGAVEIGALVEKALRDQNIPLADYLL